MALRDVLFGRKKLSEPQDDRLFALTTAAVTLETELGLTTAGAAAVTFKPQSSGRVPQRVRRRRQADRGSAQQCGSQVERKTDEYGFDWMIVHDPDLEDLVATAAHARGGADRAGLRLTAARGGVPVQGRRASGLLDLRLQARRVLAVRPDSADQKRDNATELELKAKLEKELPVEQDLTRWLALFDAPI